MQQEARKMSINHCAELFDRPVTPMSKQVTRLVVAIMNLRSWLCFHLLLNL